MKKPLWPTKCMVCGWSGFTGELPVYCPECGAGGHAIEPRSEDADATSSSET